jgi:hypothetical protein
VQCGVVVRCGGAVHVVVQRSDAVELCSGVSSGAVHAVVQRSEVM